MSVWKPVPALTIAVVVLALGSACSPESRSQTKPDGVATAEMEHIHGIGVDPEDGAVYAGTHEGLFRIADGRATRVADRDQDFMGFTVAGPERFFASGHPGEGQEGPSSVGLIESDDAGETWQEVSLGGEADFHALEYRHDRVYGLNAMTGQLLVSTDTTSWEELSRTPIADFAVSPAEPEVLIATSQQGLTRSTDGGRSFAPVDSAPLMVFVSWAADGTIAGVTPEGVVHTAEDPTGAWSERGTLNGPPEALTAESSSAIYAAANGAVLLSTDGGRRFITLAQ